MLNTPQRHAEPISQEPKTHREGLPSFCFVARPTTAARGSKGQPGAFRRRAHCCRGTTTREVALKCLFILLRRCWPACLGCQKPWMNCGCGIVYLPSHSFGQTGQGHAISWCPQHTHKVVYKFVPQVDCCFGVCFVDFLGSQSPKEQQKRLTCTHTDPF